METAQQHKKQYQWLKEYQWKPGQSGNPEGKKPGKSLKEWAKEFLMELPDAEKLEFLKELDPDIVWRMAEGNPHQSGDTKVEFNPKPLLDVLRNNDSNKEDSKPTETN